MWLTTVLAVALALVVGLVVGHLVAARRSSGEPVRPQAPVAEPDPVEQREEPVAQPGGFGPLAEAVERISHGIVVMDRHGEVIYRNRMARRIAVSRHSRSLVEDCVQRLLGEAREGQSHSESVELFGPPAELFRVSAHPYRDGTGIGAMAVVEDHSDMRRTETVRRDFVANISHELKTPIGALGLLAETIGSEHDPEVMKRLAQRMVAEADRAAHTIDDLLELSRIEFADDMETAEVALADVVAEVESRIAHAAEQAGIAVVSDLDAAVAVNGDARQLASALFNLVDNAVKYSPPESEVVIGAEWTPGSDEVRLSVLDRGIGIPRGSMERVFERFYRVDRARSRNTGGTGLGLAIVRHVVSNHGGSMELDSTEGLGSRFTMVLPMSEEMRALHGATQDPASPEVPADTSSAPTGTAPTGTEPTGTAPTETGTEPRWIPS